MLDLLFLILIIAVVCFVGLQSKRLNREIKSLHEWEDGESLRASDMLAANTKAVDKDKPWPVCLISHLNGVQIPTSLQALEIEYKLPVIGTFDGWKIYDRVIYKGDEFVYDNVAVKRQGRYLLKAEATYLILAPGLSYKKAVS